LRKSLFLLLWISLTPFQVFGASCCGGASQLPTLITGNDNTAQLQTSFSDQRIQGDFRGLAQSSSRSTGDNEHLQTISIEGALLLSDRWQIGAGLPLIRRSREFSGFSGESVGFGDPNLSAGYEWLTEWSYSVWKPKAFVYFRTSLPFGRSALDSELPYLLDSVGKGFASTALGNIFLKTWGDFDLNLSWEIKRFLPRTTQKSFGEIEWIPGWGTQASLALGYSPVRGPVRFGLALSGNWEEAIRSEGALFAMALPIRSLHTMASVSYLWDAALSTSLTLTDNSMFSSQSNTPIIKTIGFFAQYRWLR